MTTRSVIYPRDHPIVLPPYSSPALIAGITGKIKLEVRYIKGRTKVVRVVSDEFGMGKANAKDHPFLVVHLRNQLIAAVRRWALSLNLTITNALLVEYRLDPAVAANAVTYSVEYDKYGAVTKLVITGSAARN